ncbi:testis-expressed sequence 2 protein-like, partial [Tropilaelaps mercedesae]
MFKGKANVGTGTGGQGGASKSLLLETSFHFHSGKDDIEGIVGGFVSSSSPSSLTSLSPLALLCGSDSLVEQPMLLPDTSNGEPSAAHNQSNKPESRAGFRENSPQSILDVSLSQNTECGVSGTGLNGKSEVGSAETQDKDCLTPPPPPSTPQHNTVKDLVSRFRKQAAKDHKNKENQWLNEKDKQESLVNQNAEMAKNNHSNTKEAMNKDIGVSDPAKDNGRDRDSRSPSPGSEPRSETSKGSNKDIKDRSSNASTQESRDASWFGG